MFLVFLVIFLVFLLYFKKCFLLHVHIYKTNNEMSNNVNLFYHLETFNQQFVL